jgi:multiple sugar transport system ATP-binding protein
MARVRFVDVTKRYGDDGPEAISGLNLDIADGEFVVLVGSSGSGKSTALRMLAGLEDISSGEIWIGDRVVNDLAPRDRDIAMVFQNYALYPHMSVRENMGFALQLEHKRKQQIDEKVRERPSRWSSTSSWTASRRSCRAGSASGSRWVARSCASRRRS